MSTVMQNSAPTHSDFTSGQHFLEIFMLLPQNNQNHKLMVTSMFLSSNSKHDFCYALANISPSHIQWHAQLSPLHNNISFPYFFPFYETCSINVNSLFHAAIKNLHIKPNGNPPLLTTTISEGITHTCKNTSLR